jgi:hypothetical protein
MRQHETLRAILRDALRQMDSDNLSMMLCCLALFAGGVIVAWFVLLWKLAQLWKGCV